MYRFVQAQDEILHVTTTGYQYTVLDQNQQEILAFHWHPEGISDEREPHLHVGASVIDVSAADLGKSFSRMHIPTGHISLARVVRMLITEFGVVPNRQTGKQC